MSATGPLASLAYVGVSSPEVAAWKDFATGLVGMELIDATSSTAALRMDSRRQRLMVSDDGARGFYGWEARDAAALGTIADRLDRAGVAHRGMTTSECAQRFVADGLTFADPGGNRMEVVLDPIETSEPFTPSRQHSGFRTGALGMGHIVLTAPDPERLVRFYIDVLGFALSDYCIKPFKAFFMHLNARHHSLAVVEMPQVGVHHLMLEMNGLDDVGQAYDLALADPDQIGVTLGRHSNDHMFSFYARTPSPFMVECGWGGRSIDPSTWQPCELLDGPSMWGHDRKWLPEEKQRQAYDMRVLAAQKGVRAPVHVQPGNYTCDPDPVAPITEMENA